MLKYYDVAVVGAGPAGSLCAAIAAKAGLKVILLEKEKLPREKPCGGLLSPRACSLLPQGFTMPPDLAAPVQRVRVHSRCKKYEAGVEKAPGMVVRRSQFDRLLAGYANLCGAVIREAHSLVKLEYRKGIYNLECGGAGKNLAVSARHVVGADGAWSSCARLSGLRRSALAGPAAWGCTVTVPQAEAAGKDMTAEFFPLPLRSGLGWSFQGRGWLNRGTGGLAGPSRLKRELSRLFSPLPAGARIYTWPLPFTGPLRRAWRENLLLVGDAAGLVEPFSGEGIYHALKSARLAAEAVLAAAGKEEVTAGSVYARLYRHHFTACYHRSIFGALGLLIRSAIVPGTLPRSIAAIMHNRGWFNRELSEKNNAWMKDLEAKRS